jgi:hypothetical protein
MEYIYPHPRKVAARVSGAAGITAEVSIHAVFATVRLAEGVSKPPIQMSFGRTMGS